MLRTTARGSLSVTPSASTSSRTAQCARRCATRNGEAGSERRCGAGPRTVPTATVGPSARVEPCERSVGLGASRGERGEDVEYAAARVRGIRLRPALRAQRERLVVARTSACCVFARYERSTPIACTSVSRTLHSPSAGARSSRSSSIAARIPRSRPKSICASVRMREASSPSGAQRRDGHLLLLERVVQRVARLAGGSTSRQRHGARRSLIRASRASARSNAKTVRAPRSPRASR